MASLRQATAAGFTMIECLVVVVILSVVIAIAAPSFRSFLEWQQVKALAYDLTADLQLARDKARHDGVNVTITRTGASWDSGWTMATDTTPARTIATRNRTAQSVTVLNAPAAITFDGVNGGRISSPSSDVQITISASSASRCIQFQLSGIASSSVGACS
jgi:type IV fimbrial biogenesis protein FimT